MPGLNHHFSGLQSHQSMGVWVNSLGAAEFSTLSEAPTAWSFSSAPLLLRMTLSTLELRYITKIDGMLERLVGFMAILALVFGERAQINRMLE